ncbi:MAG: tRNA uridine-5-carboxymethylaminomethyl(34) synthesis GTPase MnmE [Sphaerochaetaceae bacterium]|nr:tRNA uridine-5-carboxymethylaminomethyl(34) synthesis GTPase MnmE [Sphaerochaetaceae bacterium]
MRYETDDVIFALATGFVKSAIAVIRVSGKNCIAGFAPYFKCRESLTSVSSNTAVYGHVKDIDDVIITVFRDGHGYTGEESFEISCHGSTVTVRNMLSLLSSIGFRQASGGEFTLRAFCNGKLDLTRAEAVNALINSEGQRANSQALAHLEGSLFRRINEIKEILAKVMSTVEVQLDYAEDEISEDTEIPVTELEQAATLIEELTKTYGTGRLYCEGAKVVLAGAANAGKSSLFNLFLKEDRAIVSPVEGTTRDYIEARCEISGIPVRLYDTAGLRESDDAVEEEGVRRSRTLLEAADVIIYLIDALNPVTDEAIFSDDRCIAVVNKTDAGNFDCEGALRLSVKTGEGFDRLCSFLSDRLLSGVAFSGDGDVIIQSKRQYDTLVRALENVNAVIADCEKKLPLDILAVDLQEALEALGELTGEVTADDILDRIFSNFCVGK